MSIHQDISIVNSPISGYNTYVYSHAASIRLYILDLCALQGSLLYLKSQVADHFWSIYYRCQVECTVFDGATKMT